ncbi:MAG: hypothetical protein QNJ46_05820 [Leptolyngbyaceae cyanobacterium MO_188.B28]|nr:hypothetical protein [Leptolyngbyaceae cyanobacterium MO_188.B28]
MSFGISIPTINIPTQSISASIANSSAAYVAELNAMQAALAAEKQKNANLTAEVASLTTQISVLKEQFSAQSSASEEFSAIVAQGSQAILDASTSQESATRAADAASVWVEAAHSSANLAVSSDPASAAAAEAQLLAQTAQTKQATALQHVTDVNDAVARVNELARTFISTPAEVSDAQKNQLETSLQSLQDHVSALSTVLNELKVLADSAAQQAAIAAVEYDNWDMLGSLFGFVPPSNAAPTTEATVDTTNGATVNNEVPVLEEIDNWQVVQKKFSIPELISNGGGSV